MIIVYVPNYEKKVCYHKSVQVSKNLFQDRKKTDVHTTSLDLDNYQLTAMVTVSEFHMRAYSNKLRYVYSK